MPICSAVYNILYEGAPRRAKHRSSVYSLQVVPLTSPMATRPHRILLSFDIEEFDVPREHGVELPMEEQVHISVAGSHAPPRCTEEAQGTCYSFSVRRTSLSTLPRSSSVSSPRGMSSHRMVTTTGPLSLADLKKSKDCSARSLAGCPCARLIVRTRMMPRPRGGDL